MLLVDNLGLLGDTSTIQMLVLVAAPFPGECVAWVLSVHPGTLIPCFLRKVTCKEYAGGQL